MGFIHCVYASTSVTALSAAELGELLAVSRRNNDAAGVTGMLLYSQRSFFQVLEGPAPAVEATYLRIASDPRHRDVTQVILEPIRQRSFAEWTMGYTSAAEKDLGALVGLNDFFLAAPAWPT